MKVAIITDIHWGARGASKYWISLMEEFYANTFFPTLKERGIDTVWLLGDTFDNRTSLNILALEAARRSFFDVAEVNNIKIYAILGNHDVVYRDSNHANSMAVIAKAYPNVHLIYETETIVFDGCPINFVSWVNKNNMKSCMDFIDTCPPTILCGHFEISSFQMTPGQYNEHGFSPDLFKRFDKVFSGHFHTISNDGRIYYISNPFELN
jgi:UDP-2,3-diacylglucosamine pyrophosphatase LpxH